MEITINRYVNPYSRASQGTQEVTIDSKDIHDVRPASKSVWIDDELALVTFKDGRPSITVGSAELLKVIVESGGQIR